jgi:3D (Asp-Asp-Asp) domain-containing protein
MNTLDNDGNVLSDAQETCNTINTLTVGRPILDDESGEKLLVTANKLTKAAQSKRLFSVIIITAAIFLVTVVSVTAANIIDSYIPYGYRLLSESRFTYTAPDADTAQTNAAYEIYKKTCGISVNIAGTRTVDIQTPVRTVGEIIDVYFDESYLNADLYEIVPSIDVMVSEGLSVLINKIEFRELVSVTEKPFTVVYNDVATIPKGTEVVVQSGENATVIQTFNQKFINGILDFEELISEKVSKPATDQIVMRGTGGTLKAKNGKTYDYDMVMSVTATAYGVDTGYGGDGEFSATGKPMERGIIAVDPDVIPLHSMVYITGGDIDGIYYAEDVGGAIRGNRIDVFLGNDNLEEQLAFGRKTLTLYIIDRYNG